MHVCVCAHTHTHTMKHRQFPQQMKKKAEYETQRTQFLHKSTWWTLWQSDCLPPPILETCEKYCVLLAGMWSKMTHKSSFISAVVLAEKDESLFFHLIHMSICLLPVPLSKDYWCPTFDIWHITSSSFSSSELSWKMQTYLPVPSQVPTIPLCVLTCCTWTRKKQA